jgi:hypothetical protein
MTIVSQIAKEAFKSWQEVQFSSAQPEIRWCISVGSSYLNLLRTCFIDVNPAQPVTDVRSVFTWDKIEPYLPAASEETRRAVAKYTKDGDEMTQLDIGAVFEFCLELLSHVGSQVATDVEVNKLTTNALEILHNLIRQVYSVPLPPTPQKKENK